MPRINLNIEMAVLREIKALQKKGGRSLGKIVSELLAEALAQRRAGAEAPRLRWLSRRMDALVDLSDKEAIHTILDKREE